MKVIFSCFCLHVLMISCDDHGVSIAKMACLLITLQLYSVKLPVTFPHKIQKTWSRKPWNSISWTIPPLHGGGLRWEILTTTACRTSTWFRTWDPTCFIQEFGDFQFEDITRPPKQKITRVFLRATMLDINNDGWLDIYVKQSRFFQQWRTPS